MMNMKEKMKWVRQKMKEKFVFRRKEKEEKEDFEKLYQNIPNEVLKARIKSSGNWYIERAIRFKRLFEILGLISIILPLIISILNNFEKTNLAVSICALLTALVTSLLTFTKCREKWTLYRTTIEQIKRELTLYWVDELNDEKLKELAIKIEDIMAQEHKVWIQDLKERKDQTDNVDK